MRQSMVKRELEGVITAGSHRRPGIQGGVLGVEEPVRRAIWSAWVVAVVQCIKRIRLIADGRAPQIVIDVLRCCATVASSIREHVFKVGVSSYGRCRCSRSRLLGHDLGGLEIVRSALLIDKIKRSCKVKILQQSAS